MSRIEAFKSCLLNTCVRFARDTYPDQTLLDCRKNRDFCSNAIRWLGLPFFTTPIEPAMETARLQLIKELSPYSGPTHIMGAQYS